MLNKLIDIQLNTKFGFRIGKCYIMIYPFDWQLEYEQDDWSNFTDPPCTYHSFLCFTVTIDQ